MISVSFFFRLSLLGFLFTLPLSIYGQEPEDLQEARRLQKLFPDDRVAATLVEETYSFEKSRSEERLPLVAAQCNTAVNFLALRERASIQYFEFYNSFSSINAFRQLEKSKGIFGLKRNYNVGFAIDRSASSSEFFSDDSRVKYFNIGFNGFGDLTRVESEKRYFDSKYLTAAWFNSWFPVKEKIIRVVVPEWLQLEIREFNTEGLRITRQKTTEKGAVVHIFKMQNLQAMKQEPQAVGYSHTYPHLLFIVKSFTSEGRTEKGFADVGDLYNWYNHLYKKSVNQPEALRSKVNELITGKTGAAEKVKSIFYWVQDQIRYIAFEDGLAGFIPASAQDVYRSRYGDCKGMANLLTEMLRLAGFEAYMTWIGTRHIPYDYSLPSLAVDNHCISTVFIEGREYFLDATEKYIPFGEYAWRIQGKQALVGKGSSFEIKKVPVQEPEQNKIHTQSRFQLKGQQLVGHVKVTLTGEQRTRFHQYYHELPTPAKKLFIQRFFEYGNRNLQATNVRTSDLANREIPVIIEGDIDLSNYVITEGKETYAGIDFFPENLKSLDPDEKRVQDYALSSNYTTEDETELVLPDGYRVSALPPGLNEVHQDYAATASYEVSGNTIRFKKKMSFSGTVRKANFAHWKNFIKKLKDFNSQLLMISRP